MQDFFPGCLILYKTGGKKELAIITEIIGNKASILNEYEKKIKIPISKILYTLNYCFQISKFTDKTMANNLLNLENESDEISCNISLNEVYETLKSENRGFTPQEIADLYFSEPITPEKLLAVIRILDEDKIYFRSKANLFYPKPNEEVNLILEQKQLAIISKELKEKEKADSIKWLKEFFTNQNNENEKLMENKKISPPNNVVKYLEPLRKFLMSNDEPDKKASAVEILDEIADNTFFKTSQNITDSILNLFVKLGIFKTDENLSIIKYQIPTEFSAEAKKEASLIILNHDNSYLEKLKDNSHLITLSIDDEETTDIDDALSIEFIDNNLFKVYVHISDVSYFIKPGSLLDKEALERGTTVYLPDRKISMFPSELSDNLISLLPGKLSPALTFEIIFNNNGNIINKNIYPSKIKIDHKLNYSNATELIENNDKAFLSQALCQLYKLSKLLNKERINNGAFPIESIEVKVRVQPDGEIKIKKNDTSKKANSLIQEFMILCNRLAADFCLINRIPAFYFCQPAPDEKIEHPGNEKLTRDKRFEILRKFRKSEICLAPSLHFSLGLSSYTQATSPIRRFHDLIIHRQIKAFLNGEKPPYNTEEIQKIAATAEQTSRTIQMAERETIRYWILKYHQKQKGQITTATVLRKLTNSLLVEMDETLTSAALITSKYITPGQSVNVRIENANPRQDTLYLRLV